MRIVKATKEIKPNEYDKKVNIQKQNVHIVGTKEYNPKDDKSILIIEPKDIQSIIDKTAGTGEPEFIKNTNRFANKELIVYNNIVGKAKSISGEWVDTNRFYIVYSKSGTHIYPTLKGNGK